MNFGTKSVVCFAYQFRKTRGIERGFMGPIVKRPRLHGQILQLVSRARLTPDVLAPVSAIFSLVIPRVIRAYGLVLTDIKRLVLTRKFSPRDFLRVRTQVSADDVTRHFPPPTQEEK